MPLDLAQMQRWFYDLVTAPTSVAESGRTPDEIEAVVRGDARLSAVERLDVYAHMYFFRLLDVLRGDYPKLATLLGHDAFHNLATDYLLACRPAHPSLRNAGERLPGFLRTHAVGLERPFFAELAALERARVEVFDAPDAAALTIESLRARPAETFAALPLRLIPALARIEAEHAIDQLWEALEEAPEPETPLAAIEPISTALIVWRQELTVFHRPLEPIERSLLPLLAAGSTFGTVCDTLVDQASADEVAPLAFSLLARWAQDGWLLA